MSISERYRDIVAAVGGFLETSREQDGDAAREVKSLEKAAAVLHEHSESVGEIPRIRLESQLTPVLLKAHSHLDRARLLLEESGAEDRGAMVWELEQKIYRLLNDL